jgi:hypothetical protein
LTAPWHSAEGRETLAKNRYGWQKRAKELARKQKHDDKLKRRQNKATTPEGEETPETFEETMNEPVETDDQLSEFPQD